MLLRENCDPENIPYPSKLLPDPAILEILSTRGDFESIKSLFDSRSEWQEHDAQKALSIAMRNSNYPIVRLLLSKGIALRIGDVIEAINLKSYNSLQAFLDYGFDINQQENLSCPPLLSKTFHDLELTKWFLDHGAKPNARCYFETTPLCIAIRDASFTAIKLLFEYEAPVHSGSLLHYAIWRKQDDRMDVIQYLLSKGARLNDVLYQHDPMSYHHFLFMGVGTPLHEAAEDGDEQLVDFLLENNADPTIKDPKGRDLIEVANSPSIVQKTPTFLY